MNKESYIELVIYSKVKREEKKKVNEQGFHMKPCVSLCLSTHKTGIHKHL